MDPHVETARMYPHAAAPSTTAAATAALYAHFAVTRAQCVRQSVPRAFWDGSVLLRALAVYIRGPIYVWEVDETGVAHVHQYSYQTFTTTNGDTHETVVCRFLMISKLLRYWHLAIIIMSFLLCWCSIMQRETSTEPSTSDNSRTGARCPDQT